MGYKLIFFGKAYDSFEYVKKFIFLDIILSGVFFLLEFVDPLINIALVLCNLASVILSVMCHLKIKKTNDMNHKIVKFHGIFKLVNCILRAVFIIFAIIFFFVYLFKYGYINYFYSDINLGKGYTKALVIILYLLPMTIVCLWFCMIEFNFFWATNKDDKKNPADFYNKLTKKQQQNN